MSRIVVLAEGASGDADAGKTMRGVLRYRSGEVVAIVDSGRAGRSEGSVPVVATLEEALPLEPDIALVGVATTGGRFPPEWRPLLLAALRAGLHLQNGLHEFLGDDAELRAVADAAGARITDLRRPPANPSVATGANLEVPAAIVTTVGSDCSIGKMTVALELNACAQRRGLRSVFVPTGQTGISIAGWGASVDAVVADFIAGTTEALVVEGHRRGGEVLFVEGQGSLSHPAYSGVTLGLMHGSAPHLFVLCHRAERSEIRGYAGHPLLSLRELVGLHEAISLPARPARVACVAVNTAGLDDDRAAAAIEAAAKETGLPADDVVRNGADSLLDVVLRRLP